MGRLYRVYTRKGGQPAAQTELHPWYPGLDLRTLPFHVGAGDYGPQFTVVPSVAPNVTGPSVTVNTWAEFVTQWKLNNRTITVGTTMTSNGAAVDGNCSDIDCIVPPGILLKSPNFGQFAAGHTFTRCRIRGNTLGQHSGGQLHFARWYGVPTDFHIDGLDVTGPATHLSDAQQRYALSVDVGNRFSLTNCRGAAGAYFMIEAVDNLFVGGCSIHSSLQARNVGGGGNEGWTFRQVGGLGAHIFVGNDLRTNRYNVLRVHPIDTTGYMYLKDNRMINLHEGALVTINQNLVTGPKGYLRGFWQDGDFLWTDIDLAPGDVSQPHNNSRSAAYVRFMNLTVRSDELVSNSNLLIDDISESEAGSPPNTPIPDGIQNWDRTNNSFSAYAAPVGWKSTTPGDPTGLNWDIGLT